MIEKSVTGRDSANSILGEIMKTSFFTAAALAGLLALSGCAAAASDSAAPTAGSGAPVASAAAGAAEAPSPAAPSSPSADAAVQPSPQATGSTEGKVHFTGDYTQTTEADSAKLTELSKQWYSPEKEAALKAKLEGAGLSSNIPASKAGEWYSRAAASCQAMFDGHPLTPPSAVWVEIDSIVRATYCPELD
jgi:hypothetical protein